MRAHLKSTDLHPITIVCSFCRKASCGETKSNITIITHRRVETKSYLAIIVLITLSMAFLTVSTAGHLFILLFFFQFSFFLWIKLGLFLLFLFAFIFFSLIAHICFSFFENDLYFLTCPRNPYRSEKPRAGELLKKPKFTTRGATVKLVWPCWDTKIRLYPIDRSLL